MPQAPVANASATPLSATAKKLQHILNSKLPIAREEEPIQVLLKVIKACSNEELAALGLQPPSVPALCLASCTHQQQLATRLEAAQSFISSLQYNSCIGYNYNVAKKRPLHSILATAAGILQHSLPIKCIEAVFLGVMLTQGWSQLQRLPVGFKSRGSDGQVYRHIVLAVCDTTTGLYGALGISRCRQLMDKPLQYSSLAALVDDYHSAYRHVKHNVLRVRVGLPVEHDNTYLGPVCWRFCTVNMQRCSWQEAAGMLNAHAAAAADLQQQFREVASPAITSSGCKSVPQSPRTGPAALQAARPHSALRIRCSTPKDPEPHLRGPNSPRKQQQGGMWRSPAASSCSSPSSGQHTCPASSSPQPTTSPNPARPRPQHVLTSQAKPVRESCTSPRLLMACTNVHISFDAATSDEDADDSDSELNFVIQQMRLLQPGAASVLDRR